MASSAGALFETNQIGEMGLVVALLSAASYADLIPLNMVPPILRAALLILFCVNTNGKDERMGCGR
jgi:hypothetical protein